MIPHPRRLAIIPRVARAPRITVHRIGPRSMAGLGSALPMTPAERKKLTSVAAAKKLGCKQGAEYTSKGWQCREQNPAVAKQLKYKMAMNRKRIADLIGKGKLKVDGGRRPSASSGKAKKLTPQRAFELLRAGRSRVAAKKAQTTAPTVKIGNIRVAPIPIGPGKDAVTVLNNESKLVTTETDDEGGIGLGALLAGAAAVAAVGGIAYLLLSKKGGAPAPATRRSSVKRSTRRSTAPISSERSTLRSGTAVLPNKHGSTKAGRWWLYSDESGNYLLTTKSHASGSVLITIDDVTHGSAKRLGQVTAPWPKYESQADDLVQKLLR